MWRPAYGSMNLAKAIAGKRQLHRGPEVWKLTQRGSSRLRIAAPACAPLSKNKHNLLTLGSAFAAAYQNFLSLFISTRSHASMPAPQGTRKSGRRCIGILQITAPACPPLTQTKHNLLIIGRAFATASQNRALAAAYQNAFECTNARPTGN